MLLKRSFSLRQNPTKAGKLCQSLPLLQQFAQIQFLVRFQQLEDNLKNCGTPYAIKLLRTANRFLGKKQKKSQANFDIKVDLKALQEKVYIKILEDCDDPGTVDTDSLIQACYIFDEFSHDAQTSITVKEVYYEILKRSYLLKANDIEQMNTVFSRIGNLSNLKFVPNLKADIKQKLKNVSINDLVADKIGASNAKKPTVNYNAEMERLTLHKDGVRYVLQSIGNYGLENMQKIIYNIDKEKSDLLFLSLPQRDNLSLLKTQTDIDQFLGSYVDQGSKYKVGISERVIYEKLQGLKTANISLSTLYSLSSQGNGLFNIPVGLMLPNNDHSINLAYQQMNQKQQSVNELFINLKNQVFLDQMEWLGLVISTEGCPQCQNAKIGYGPDFHYPFIKSLTNKEISKSFLIKRIAQNMKDTALQMKKEDKTLKVVAFVDNSYCSVFDIAKELAKNETSNEIFESQIENEDYLKLSFLFDGVGENNKVSEQKVLHSALWRDLKGVQLYEMLEPHKYDYKCFPVHLLKSNDLLIK